MISPCDHSTPNLPLKNSMRFHLSLLLLPLLAAFGCSDKPPKPDDLISEDEYIELMVELQLVRSYGETLQIDSTTIDSLTDKVFDRYSTTDSTFQKSHNYYQQFPQEHVQRIDKAIEQLKMDQVGLENDREPTRRDTVISE